MQEEQNEDSIGYIVRKMEDDYSRGNVHISEYVTFDMYTTINTIEAYLNSKHTSGEFDSQGREKPFFNIVNAAANIWMKATDLDRKDIKVKAPNSKEVINAFLCTIHLQNWMVEAKFGQYLNEWGRVLARYGSAITKSVVKGNKLIITVPAWNRMIVDQIDFENNTKIEILELTEAQLRKRTEFNKEQVTALLAARKARETIRKTKKDNKNDYVKLYEVHGEFSNALLKLSKGEKPTEADRDVFTQQMHIISFVSTGKKGEFEDFTLYSGKEKEDPYRIAHLIKEDGRTLSVGSVEHLFQSQWIVNHTAKSTKDQLDVASKLIFQTADASFLGQNALSAIENGDILIHQANNPLTQLGNNSHDITSLQEYGAEWKQLGNEIVGISDAMLGKAPKAGEAWRQTEAVLTENYSLFKVMTENKGLALEELLREVVLPFIKTQLDNTDEVVGTLEANDIQWIDSKYIKNYATTESNKMIVDAVLKGSQVTPAQQQNMMTGLQNGMTSALNDLGNKRFFKPSEIKSRTWKKQFENLNDLEIDITGENKDYQANLETLNTALQVVMNPAYAQNKQAQMIVGKILMNSGNLSPLEVNQVNSQPLPTPQPTPTAAPGGGSPAVAPQLQTTNQ